MAGTGGGGVTPELTLAWARAIARAYDEPAFRRRLESGAVNVLNTEYGVDVNEDTVKKLAPTLDEALTEIDKQEKLVRAARESAPGSTTLSRGSGVAPAAPTYAVPAPYPVPVYVSVPVARGCCAPPLPPPPCCAPGWPGAYASAPMNFGGAMQPYPMGMQGAPFGPYASIYASQVATTRTVTERGSSPPQWLGGPPSGGHLQVT